MTPTPVNPLGAKGVGEAGTLGSTPCIVNAAVDALSEFGVTAHRHDAAAREAVAHHPRRPGVIPTAFDYARATSLDDALAKLKAADGGGKLIAGGHSLVPLMKLRLSEPQRADRHRRIPELSRHHGDGTARSRSAPPPCTTTSQRRRCCSSGARCSPRPPRRSAIRRCATAARSAAASRTPIRRPTMPAVMLALDAEIHLKGPTGWRVVKGAGLLPGSVHRRPGAPTRSSPSVQFTPVRSRRLRQAAPARVALRHRRRRGGARGA